MMKTFQRLCDSQHVRKTVDELQAKDKKLHSAILRSFQKAREGAQKAGSKIKFGIQGFIEEYKSSQGVRREEVGEMLWEGEWYELSRQAKFGHLSRSEAEKKWELWLEDDEVPKDLCGPHGYVRCWVKVKDQVVRYQDVEHSKKFRREEKLSKGASTETLNHRLRTALGEDNLPSESCVPLAVGLEDKAFQALGSNDVLATGDGVLSLDVSSLVDAQAKRRGKGGDEPLQTSAESKNTKEGAEEEDEEEEEEKKKKEEAWFDAELRCPEAEKAWEQVCRKMRQEADKVAQDMADVIHEFRSDPHLAKVSPHSEPSAIAAITIRKNV